MSAIRWPIRALAIRGTKSYRFGKRILDVVLSIVLLICALPLFVVIALSIRATSAGPVFFKQQRIGRRGRMFWCYKFRTMVQDAESILDRRPDLKVKYLESFKLDDDIRVTPVGRFLRKTSLDELPQLINVLRGDISLIGPRPIVRAEIAKYGKYAGKLLSVTPGLSGLWQVSGRSETTYEERVALDMDYIDHHSLWYDTKLIFRTMMAVLTRRGAC